MTRNHKFLRLAIAIYDRIGCQQAAEPNLVLPDATWQHAQGLLRRIQLAQQHGWSLASTRIERDLEVTLRQLRAELNIAADSLDRNSKKPAIPSPLNIYHDLLALHDEFDGVSFDRSKRTLSATTEPIELDGVYLGPFEICLDWADLLDGHPHNYRVIAVDPHPAATNDSLTHPHVQDEAVCEGDGRLPIRQALEQGRLLDFYLIVRNLLGTYNSSSPYCSLRDWYGVSCVDCNATVSDDESYTCQRCDSIACGECYYFCGGCDEVYCSDCVSPCENCDQTFCRRCLTQCSKCREISCQGCLDDNERCDDCHEEENEKPTANEIAAGSNGEQNSVSRAPIQPHRVGQTAVPA